jgi:hypothetical protein
MRFVPIKNAEQRALLALHRARQGFVHARTARGQAPHAKAGCMAAISSCDPERERVLGIVGASMYGALRSSALLLFVELLGAPPSRVRISTPRHIR